MKRSKQGGNGKESLGKGRMQGETGVILMTLTDNRDEKPRRGGEEIFGQVEFEGSVNH